METNFVHKVRQCSLARVVYPCSKKKINPNSTLCALEELYILPGMETFAKEPKFGKLLQELKSTPVRC